LGYRGAMVPAIRINLRSFVSSPIPLMAVPLNHHGPHTPLEWAIYLVTAGVLVGVVVAVVRQKDPR
jgi:hypothetical protein